MIKHAWLVPIWLAWFVFLAACTSQEAARTENGGDNASDAPEAPQRAAGAPVSQGRMTINWYRPQAGDTGRQRPMFRFSSDNCRILEHDSIAFEDGRAVILTGDGEELELQAGSGRLDQQAKVAQLDDGVRMELNDIVIQLESLTWSNAERRIDSDEPVAIQMGASSIEAESMTFYPDTRRYVLEDARMRLRRQEDGLQ